MKIEVRVTPSAKKDSIEKGGDVYRVRLNAPASGGKANSALIKLLAEHFGVKKQNIRIVSGHKSREKSVEIC